MKQVALPGSGRMTSQLGFGCSFPEHIAEDRIAQVLDAAYDAGIRHYDVAPYYLDGKAELYLGRFLSRHSDVSVTTKYGLRPKSARPLHLKMAAAVLGPVYRRLRSQGAASSGASPDPLAIAPTAKASFAPNDIASSLARSMALLKRDQVDLLLFHEPDGADLDGPDLLDAMSGHVSSGRIGAFGVAAERPRVVDAYARHPDLCPATQFDWDATSPEGGFEGTFNIQFRVFTRDFTTAAARPGGDFAGEFAAATGIDLRDAQALRAMLLKAALLHNPNGITLISSTSPQHVIENVAAAEDSRLDAPAEAFLRMARHRLG